MLRLFTPGNEETVDAFVDASRFFLLFRDYRRSFELLKRALHLLQARAQALADREYIHVLELLSWLCANVDPSQFQIEFQDVFEILDIMTSKQQNYYPLRASQVHSFVEFVVKLDKRPDQLISFKRVVQRLVHSQVKFADGRTLLHHAVEQCGLHQCCMSVVELLLECGADVNAVDRENNTALHLCTRPKALIFPTQKDQVIKLLLRYSAHIDIVNDYGDLAAKNLPLNILNHVNLQCLAASVIRDRQIHYMG